MKQSKYNKILFAGLIVIFIGTVVYSNHSTENTVTPINYNLINEGGLSEPEFHPLSIESLRQGEYPGSEIVFEQKLEPGSNYQRYIASYKSEGLKIYGLLTIPNGSTPEGGWPAIIFNHGYIPPAQYKTTERYLAYTDAFSRNGYVLFKPDYRGHGNSEGAASGGYGSNGYTIDAMNALASIKTLKDENQSQIVNQENIGMWGHSMGGHITLESMVVNKEIKAGVIWAGVVGSYEDLFNRWRRRGTLNTPSSTSQPSTRGGRWRQELSESYGTPEKNPEFWNSLSATSFLNDLSGPIQIHHGTNDTSVPVEFSVNLDEKIKATNKVSELFIYNGDDHNLSQNFSIAINRSVEFFDKYLKN